MNLQLPNIFFLWHTLNGLIIMLFRRSFTDIHLSVWKYVSLLVLSSLKFILQPFTCPALYRRFTFLYSESVSHSRILKTLYICIVEPALITFDELHMFFFLPFKFIFLLFLIHSYHLINFNLLLIRFIWQLDHLFSTPSTTTSQKIPARFSGSWIFFAISMASTLKRSINSLVLRIGPKSISNNMLPKINLLYLILLPHSPNIHCYKFIIK